jgi:hypothetical protein
MIFICRKFESRCGKWGLVLRMRPYKRRSHVAAGVTRKRTQLLNPLHGSDDDVFLSRSRTCFRCIYSVVLMCSTLSIILMYLSGYKYRLVTWSNSYYLYLHLWSITIPDLKRQRETRGPWATSLTWVTLAHMKILFEF